MTVKANIHPKYYEQARVVCACGNSWTVGSTVEEMRIDICSNCHPFYTGEQRIIDTAGQVDRFMKRLERTADTVDQVRAQREMRRRALQEARAAKRRGDA